MINVAIKNIELHSKTNEIKDGQVLNDTLYVM